MLLDKSRIDLYLDELAKLYRSRGCKVYPMELIIVGGASIALNYDFRISTYDIDCSFEDETLFKECIREVAELNNLEIGWINKDFMKTKSFSSKLSQHSVYYKTYRGVINVRTIKSEYLVAMKFKAGRLYKHDVSDAIQIINIDNLSLESIKKASLELYGDFELRQELNKLIEILFSDDAPIEEMISKVLMLEKNNGQHLILNEQDCYENEIIGLSKEVK